VPQNFNAAQVPGKRFFYVDPDCVRFKIVNVNVKRESCLKTVSICAISTRDAPVTAFDYVRPIQKPDTGYPAGFSTQNSNV
jgi:hypothetical protein